MGCKGAGMRMCEQLVAQRLWHHQLDGFAIPPDQHLILKEDGGPQGPKLPTFQGTEIIQGWTVTLRKHMFNRPQDFILVLQSGYIRIRLLRGYV